MFKIDNMLKNRLENIAKIYNCTVVFNCPHVDDNEAAIAGSDDIMLGRFLEEDWMIAAFFHEIGHSVSKYVHQDHHQKIVYEIEAWRCGFQEMQRQMFPISFDTIQYCLMKLDTYVDWNWREMPFNSCITLMNNIRKYYKQEITND